MKPTPELAQALTNLRVSDDFEVVVSFLREQREKARDDCESIIEGPKLWRAQGKAACLREFLGTTENAAILLDKFKSNT